MLQRLDFVERRHPEPRLVRGLGLALLVLMCSLAWAAPTDVILVLDNSGSMRKNDPEFLLKRAVTAFVNELGEDTQVGMVIFDQKVVYPVALGPLDVASRGRIQQSLESIDYRGKFTDIPAAIERAIYELKTNARADTARVIVFMTDGIVDTGNAGIDAEKAKWLREELVTDAADNAIRIFGIAFTDEADFFLIQSLANKTDGEYFRAPRATDLAGVFASVQKRLGVPTAVASVAAPPAPSPAPAPVAAAPAVAATCLETLSAEERLAMEETAPSAGITAEEMCQQMEQAAPGTVIVHAPPSATTAPVAADDGGGALNLIIIAVLALLLVLMVAVVVLVLRRRGSPAAAAVAPVTSPARVPEAYLKDIHGITQQGPLRLSARPVLIGRVAGSDPEHLDYFVVDKGTVGRRHALIQFRDFSFWLSDQGSVNGTFLNGERITGDRPLKHGDRVKFHKYEFEFSMPELDQANHTVFATSHDMTIAGDATLVGAPVVAVAAAASAAQAAAADRADADVFDVTGEGDDVDGGASADQVDAFVDGDDTALSARSAAASTDFFAGEDAGELHAPVIDPRDDHGDLAGFAHSSATGSGDAFDTEASAFFDDDLGSPAAYEDAAAQFGGAASANPTPSGQDDSDDFVTVLPEAAADSGIFSESETLLPEAPYADDGSSATATNISLDRFMETESFFNHGADQDREDATLMPDQVPDSGAPAPEMDDFFDITGVGLDPEAGPDDDGSESPTKLRR